MGTGKRLWLAQLHFRDNPVLWIRNLRPCLGGVVRPARHCGVRRHQNKHFSVKTSRSHMDLLCSGLTANIYTLPTRAYRQTTMGNLKAISQRADFIGPPYTIRTCDLRLRRPLLYPTELRAVGEKRHGLSRTVFGIGLSSNARQRPHRQTQTPETKRARHEAEPEIIPDHRTRSRETGPRGIKPAADAA